MVNVVHKGMLARESDSVTGDTSSANKNLPVKMKMHKCILEVIRVGSCDKVALCDVTKV